jgi:hypothetical protein
VIFGVNRMGTGYRTSHQPMAQHHPTHGPDTPEESQFQKFRPGRAAPGLGTFGGLGNAPPQKKETKTVVDL